MKIVENKRKVGNVEWFFRSCFPVQETDKSPVFFLHGLPSQSFCWTEIMPFVAESGYSAIAPDWLGWANSDKPDKRDFAYTPEAYIEALKEFIDAFKVEKISLVIQGFLATIGIQYALQNPDKIDKLIILNSPISTSAKVPWLIKQCGVPFLGDMITQDPLFVDRTLEKGAGYVISDENLAYYRKPIITSSLAGRTMVTMVRRMQFLDSMKEIEAGLKTWEKPCLIFWGIDDPWLNIEPVEAIAKANPNITLKKISEAKHYPQEHFSKKISPILVSFL
ncbi:alpha/beta fold hydrolase [Cyanobacterium sp. IPPAS B-1200]|uniref:alpha/beta fold hydrolase n=1 Tax=Cyanobacterium sp. IPPAS B-1200 TaxID=1562720 RepID=UPI0008527710|nr:alpha/beta fold hydrolase [Cyanobacterium sp. IPPAS B-1200]OEJ79008.1 hydrolase [Cyanobacterium sp. IPPAS B-1200]